MSKQKRNQEVVKAMKKILGLCKVETTLNIPCEPNPGFGGSLGRFSQLWSLSLIVPGTAWPEEDF